MKKKNLVLLGSAALLSLALAGTIGTVAIASAADNTLTQTAPEGTAETTVTYQVADAWTVTIPDAIVVGGDGITVSASGVKIEPDKTLTVTVSSENEWKVKKNGSEGSGIGYKLKAGEDEITSEVLTVEAGTANGSKEIKAELAEGNDNYSTGGEDYTDTLTFSVEVS